MTKKNQKNSPVVSNVQLDEIDRRMLRILQLSSGKTKAEIGDIVGLSPSAVSRRIQLLEDSGIIRGYQAVIDESALGLSITVFIRVTLERQSASVINAFEKAIRNWNGIGFCYLMAGQYDYLLQIKVSDIADFERIHRKELSTLPGVARIESSFSVRDVLFSATPVRSA